MQAYEDNVEPTDEEQNTEDLDEGTITTSKNYVDKRQSKLYYRQNRSDNKIVKPHVPTYITEK
jgi:hypothetical protein